MRPAGVGDALELVRPVGGGDQVRVEDPGFVAGGELDESTIAIGRIADDSIAAHDGFAAELLVVGKVAERGGHRGEGAGNHFLEADDVGAALADSVDELLPAHRVFFGTPDVERHDFEIKRAAVGTGRQKRSR